MHGAGAYFGSTTPLPWVNLTLKPAELRRPAWPTNEFLGTHGERIGAIDHLFKSLQIPQDMNPGMRSGVFFRLMMRQSLFGRGSGSNMNLGGSYQSSFFGQSASVVRNVFPSDYLFFHKIQ